MAAQPAFLLPSLSTVKETGLGSIELASQNLWPEVPHQSTQYPYVLANPPGVEGLPQIQPAFGPGTSRISGLFQQSGIFNGDLFVFWGNRVSRASALSPAVGNLTGASVIANTHFVANTPPAVTRSAATRGFLSWVDAANTAWVYDGATAVPVAGLPNSVGDVTSLSKRFVWIDIFTDQAYYSDLGLATFNALNFFTAETISDKLNCCFAHSNRLYLAGDLVTEVYIPSSNFNLPFSYSGVALPIGSKSPGSWASVENFVAMVGSTTESLGVYQVSGGGYQKISPTWLDRRLNTLSDSLRREISATAYVLEGHMTYELHIPGDGASVPPLSLAYDVTFAEWYRITDPNDVDGFARRWVSQLNTTTIVGRVSGEVGAFTRTRTSYFGAEQARRWSAFQGLPRKGEMDDIVQQLQFTTPVTDLSASPLIADKAVLNAAGGLVYSVSDNLGVDFSPPRTVTINRHNKFGQYAAVRRLGEVGMPGRVHRLECTQAFNIQVGPLFVDTGVLQS